MRGRGRQVTDQVNDCPKLFVNLVMGDGVLLREPTVSALHGQLGCLAQPRVVIVGNYLSHQIRASIARGHASQRRPNVACGLSRPAPRTRIADIQDASDPSWHLANTSPDPAPR
jgi:hypothetical protein